MFQIRKLAWAFCTRPPIADLDEGAARLRITRAPNLFRRRLREREEDAYAIWSRILE